ncbi:hypothetical protein Salat_2538600 [Sesamum alatum]|uniref:Uncharacterized protein n=1 Tax=Sesamum alatum TaxID=300844 RepID=A0AAE1XSH1_9LAMI|nr:hypothetical protein Salat_2538600 [Sesamum alatum]
MIRRNPTPKTCVRLSSAGVSVTSMHRWMELTTDNRAAALAGFREPPPPDEPSKNDAGWNNDQSSVDGSSDSMPWLENVPDLELPRLPDPLPTDGDVGLNRPEALPVHVLSMARLKEKLLRIKQWLRHWNKTTFGDIFRNLSEAEAAVRTAEGDYDHNPSDANLMEMNRATAVFQRALSVEEDFWRQKSACK